MHLSHNYSTIISWLCLKIGYTYPSMAFFWWNNDHFQWDFWVPHWFHPSGRDGRHRRIVEDQGEGQIDPRQLRQFCGSGLGHLVMGGLGHVHHISTPCFQIDGLSGWKGLKCWRLEADFLVSVEVDSATSWIKRSKSVYLKGAVGVWLGCDSPKLQGLPNLWGSDSAINNSNLNCTPQSALLALPFLTAQISTSNGSTLILGSISAKMNGVRSELVLEILSKTSSNIWANDHNSLTWIVGSAMGMISPKTMIPGFGRTVRSLNPPFGPIPLDLKPPSLSEGDDTSHVWWRGDLSPVLSIGYVYPISIPWSIPQLPHQ